MNLENQDPMEETEVESPDISEESEDLGQSIRNKIESTNIAEDLDEDELQRIGEKCKQGFLYDADSRNDWMNNLKSWLKLASLEIEEKSFPWPKAAAVKYPLITTAAMQFSARAYPSLIPANGNVVAAKIIGTDAEGLKSTRATRVSRYMSYQCMHQMDNWEEEMDKLLMTIAIKGNHYKKTFFDKTKGHSVSLSIPVERLVVHMNVKSLETAERISEIFYLFPRQVENRKRAGVYLEVELGTPTPCEEYEENIYDNAEPEFMPYVFIEQHTYLDLNEDGHQEPYIVTFELTTGKVVRIVARYDEEGIVEVEKKNGKREIVEIKPIQYYTKYGFIPNPEGGFLDIGFGHLLGPLNESMNTSINQLIDAGTLANMQGGFLGKGLRVKGGNYSFSPGEWKWVNATGDDLKKQIVPLPAKEPSQVLFKLVEFLLQAGKELASVAEIFVGKMPGQNTPATTTMASIEQGMKVFTAIYKRVYRSLSAEFKKLYKLNKSYLDLEHYQRVLDDPKAVKEDWNESDYDICPAADPTSTSQQEKIAKAEANLQLLQIGTVDPIEVTKRILEAQEQPNWEKLIPGLQETGTPAPPPPDPKVQAMQMKMQAEQQSAAIKIQAQQAKMELDSRDKQQQMAMKQQEHAMEMANKRDQMLVDSETRRQNQQIFLTDAVNKVTANKMGHEQKLQQQTESHQQKMQQSKEASKSKPKSQNKTT